MKPTAQWKDKGLQVTMWPTNNGGHSFQIIKRYKDKKTEEWKDSKYFYKEDLEKLQALIKEALAYKPEVQQSNFGVDDDIPF